MYESTGQAPPSTTEPPKKQPAAYAIFLRWVLPHILLLTPGFIGFVWASTLSPSSPTACLALPFIIGAAFASQAIGVARVFSKFEEYLLWIAAFALGFAIMFVTLFFQGVLGSSTFYQSPWGITLIGSIFGLIEALVLWRTYKRAWWWIAANAVGLTVGIFLATILSDSARAICATASDKSQECTYSLFL
ncbi:MAG: hypothetical protein ABIQ44_07270, partial [Chloroflexia bacterium]